MQVGEQSETNYKAIVQAAENAVWFKVVVLEMVRR